MHPAFVPWLFHVLLVMIIVFSMILMPIIHSIEVGPIPPRINYISFQGKFGQTRKHMAIQFLNSISYLFCSVVRQKNTD